MPLAQRNWGDPHLGVGQDSVANQGADGGRLRRLQPVTCMAKSCANRFSRIRTRRSAVPLASPLAGRRDPDCPAAASPRSASAWSGRRAAACSCARAEHRGCAWLLPLSPKFNGNLISAKSVSRQGPGIQGSHCGNGSVPISTALSTAEGSLGSMSHQSLNRAD